MDSDRLFAAWDLNSARVAALAEGRDFSVGAPEQVVEIPNDFGALLKSDPGAAKAEALRIREEFLAAFSAGLVCRAFERDERRPKYLLFREE
jgi:predicted GNAT superfamily acetyltransferase